MARTDLTITLRAITGEYVKKFNEAQNKSTQLRSALTQIGTSGAIAFAGLGATVGVAINKFAKFENRMLAVKTLMIGNYDTAEQLNAVFQDMARSTLVLATQAPVGMAELQRALFDTVSAGIDAGEAMQFLGTSSKLAVAGVTDIKTATDGMTSAVNAWKFSAEEAELVASKFFTAQKFGKTTIADLANNIGVVSGQAANMGVSLDDVLSSVSALTLGGVGTSEAFTQVRSVLTAVAKQTPKAKRAAQELGIEWSIEALQAKGLAGFIQEISDKTGGSAEKIISLVGRVEGLNAIMALGGKQSKQFANIQKELGDEFKTTEVFAQAYEEQSASLENSLKTLGNSLEVISITFGETFAPVVKLVADSVANLAQAFQNMSPIWRVLISLIVSGGAAFGALATVIGFLGPAFITGRNAIIAFTAATKSATSGTITFRAALNSIPWVAVATGLALVVDGLLSWKIAQQDATAEEKNAAATWKGIIKRHNEEINALREKIKLGKGTLADAERIQQLQRANKGILEARRKAVKALADAEAKAAADKRAILEEQLAQEGNLQQILEEQGVVISELSDKEIQEYLKKFKTKEELLGEHIFNVIEMENQANAEIIKQDKRTARERAKIEKTLQMQRVALIQQGFGNLAALMLTGNRQLFEIGKAAAVSEAVLGTYSAAAKMWEMGLKFFAFLGPGAPVAAGVLAATTIVAGLARVAQIASTPFNPGGAQEGISGGGIREPYISTFQPQEIVIPQRFSEGIKSGQYALTGANGEQMGGETVVININPSESLVERTDWPKLAREELIPAIDEVRQRRGKARL